MLQGRASCPRCASSTSATRSVSVLQYWATIRSRPSSCTRVCLVHAKRTCQSVTECMDGYPGDIDLLRGVLIPKTPVVRNECHCLRQSLRIFTIGILRIPLGQRRALALLAWIYVPSGLRTSTPSRTDYGICLLSLLCVLVSQHFSRFSERCHATNRIISSVGVHSPQQHLF